jgi:small conductance mechanosensitive channel
MDNETLQLAANLDIEALGELGSTLIAMVSTWGVSAIGAVVVLIFGRWFASRMRTLTRRGLERGGIDASLVPFLSSLTYYSVLAVVLIAVLNLFGIETTSLIAVFGAAGLAIGLALQGTLSNVSAGVMLLVFRPFRIGDFVDVAGTAGTVAEIGLFTTILNTGDNVRIFVPNSSIYGETIRNFSSNDTRRNDLVIGVSYDDDLSTAKSVIEAVLGADKRVLKDPAPVVAVSELGDSSVNFIVRPWCVKEDYWALRWDLTRKLKEDLEAAGCSMPYPQRDVHVHKTEATA